MSSKSQLRREAVQDPMAAANKIARAEESLKLISDYAMATLDFARQGKMLFWKSEMEKVEELQLAILREVGIWMDRNLS